MARKAIMSYVNYENVDRIVEAIARKGVDIHWEGWTIKVFHQNPKAIYSPAGSRNRNGDWGFYQSISPNEKGLWNIPKF